MSEQSQRVFPPLARPFFSLFIDREDALLPEKFRSVFFFRVEIYGTFGS